MLTLPSSVTIAVAPDEITSTTAEYQMSVVSLRLNSAVACERERRIRHRRTVRGRTHTAF